MLNSGLRWSRRGRKRYRRGHWLPPLCPRVTVLKTEMATEEQPRRWRQQAEKESRMNATRKMYNLDMCCSWSLPRWVCLIFGPAFPFCSNSLVWRVHLLEVICRFGFNKSETLVFQDAWHILLFFFIHEKEVSIYSIGGWIWAVTEWIIKKTFTTAGGRRGPRPRSVGADNSRCLREISKPQIAVLSHWREAICNK